MIENQSPIIQIVSMVISAWFAKETVVAVLKSLFGVKQSLSDTDKIRARVMDRLAKKNF